MMAARPWFGCALAAFCLASCISPNVALIQCSENATANGSSTDESWRICVKEQEGSTSSGEPTPVVGSGCKCNTRRGDPQSDFMPAEKQCCENNEYVCNTCLFNGKCQEKEWCDKATNLIMWGLGGGLLTMGLCCAFFCWCALYHKTKTGRAAGGATSGGFSAPPTSVYLQQQQQHARAVPVVATVATYTSSQKVPAYPAAAYPAATPAYPAATPAYPVAMQQNAMNPMAVQRSNNGY